MKLELDPTDLKPEFQKKTGRYVEQGCNTSAVTFERLNEAAQAAVEAVGKATFFAWNKETYKAIYSPDY